MMDEICVVQEYEQNCLFKIEYCSIYSKEVLQMSLFKIDISDCIDSVIIKHIKYTEMNLSIECFGS